MAKNLSRQAIEAAESKDGGWGSISQKSLAEFFDWLECTDELFPLEVEAKNEDTCKSCR